ncbi:MAG TPA: DUF1810 domain-containing protein [Acidocella sp.]|nr:DUF1810 domain-containing protein [Acidocella sp.]
MSDPFNLQRFVIAQTPVFDIVRDELAAGAKRTHWMWYIFPQIAGLGFSAMSQTYAISGRAEAQAYLAHFMLGPHLRDCTSLVLSHAGRRSAVQIFGPIDAAKFRSCMTLFSQVSDEPVFEQGLEKYFDGNADPETLARLGA